ncbi:MAG: hypothetical protein J5859_00905, partial [Clostridia bacterium]|nr:hypothetical protein [Clostridia bacterium]
MRKHNRILATVLLVSLLIALIPVSGSAVTQCYMNLKVKSSTYLYSQATTGSTKIMAIKSGAVVLCGAYTSNWCLVKYSGKIGYIPKSCCTSVTSTPKPTQAPTVSPTQAPVTADPATTDTAETAEPTPTPVPTVSPTNPNSVKPGMTVISLAAVSLYKSPSTSASKYGIITKGKVFSCIKTAGNLWAYVKVNSTTTGYCLLKDLKQYDPSTDKPSTTAVPSAETITVSMICYVKKATTLTSSLSSGFVANLKVGDKVLVTKVKGTYAYLTTTSGKKGFTLLANLSKTPVLPQYAVVLSDW